MGSDRVFDGEKKGDWNGIGMGGGRVIGTGGGRVIGMGGGTGEWEWEG